MVAPSKQVTQHLEASEALLVVMLAERVGRLNELQREFLASTLSRVRYAAELLQPSMDLHDAPIVRDPATIPEHPDSRPSP